MSGSGRPTWGREAAALGLIAAAGVAIRLANHAMVLGGEHVYFPDNDPYYHMRRILAVMADYPSVPYFDPMMNYPAGAAVIWPPLFDWLAATLCLALGAGGDPRMAETVCAFISPAIGGVTAVAVYFLARETVGPRLALPSAGIFILFPVHVWYSKIGFVDHHAAVALAHAAMFALFMRMYNLRLVDGRPWERRTLLGAGALSLAGGTLVWHGYILFIAILDGFLLAALLTERGAGRRAVADMLWKTHLPAALMVLPSAISAAAATGKPVTAISLSLFHAGAISVMGFAGAVAALEGRYPAVASRAGLGAMLGVIALAGVAALRSGAVAEGAGWAMTSDPFMASVLESQSFFVDRGGFTLLGPFLMLTALFPVAVAGAVAMIWSREGENYPGRFVLGVVTVLFFILLAKQRRFGVDFGPYQAIALAWALGRIHPVIAARAGSGSAAAMGLAVVLSCAPFHWRYTATPLLWPTMRTAADERYLRMNGFLYRLRDILHLPAPRPEGAMAFWDMGHKILYITGLGTVGNNFGLHIGKDAYRDWCVFFLAGEEAEAEAILARRNIRYVIADFDMAALNSAALYLNQDTARYRRMEKQSPVYTAEFYRTMLFRFTAGAGSQARVTGASGEMDAPGLEGFRLILDSAEDGKPGYPLAWERVAGARLILTGGAPGAVQIGYEYVTAAGRRRIYRRETVLDSKGEGEARVPYSSDRPDLGHTGRYVITQRGVLLAEVTVSEEDVTKGKTVAVTLARKDF